MHHADHRSLAYLGTFIAKVGHNVVEHFAGVFRWLTNLGEEALQHAAL